MRPRSTAFRAALPSLVLSVGATLWCWWGAGAGLGLLLGAPILVALFLPLLVSVERGWDRIASTAGAILGVAGVWAIATRSVDVTPGEWLRCTLVVGAFVIALSGSAALLTMLPIHWPVAALLTTLAALLWLTWPVWLSHALTQGIVDWLVPAHPLLAINGVVVHLGAWDRFPIAYRSLTVLNQDIPYHLPRSIWPAVLVHVAVGVPGLLVSLRPGHGLTPRTLASPEPVQPANAPAPAPTDAP